jgi:alcohol dehydrogenase class IV
MSDAVAPKGNWNYPTPTRFGAGRIRELPDACRELGITRPLLVTDPGIAGLPITREAVAINKAAGLETRVFSRIQPNPVGADVDAGVQALREGDHDGVIAFGGGSALDVGKAVGLMAGQERPLWDFEDVGDWYTRVNVDAMAPVVAVPTTSGTGSEMGRASVIINEDEPRKVIIFHPRMLPGRVIADPALTAGLPAKLTAATGMDALSHNLEAFCAPGFHPLADGIAVEGMRLIHRSLVRAVKDGADLEARSDMMAASAMGATAFQKGLGAMHALSHPVGAVLHTHHGLTNAVVMPYVLVFNRAAIEERMERLGRYLGLATPGFDGVLEWILDLRRAVGIPHTLSSLGVGEEHARELAPAAAADPSAGGNPVPLDAEKLQGLYLRAILGELS